MTKCAYAPWSAPVEHEIAETIALNRSIKTRRPWCVLHHVAGRHL